MAASAIRKIKHEARKIKHEAHGRDANKAQDKAECFIGIEVVHRVLHFKYSKS